MLAEAAQQCKHLRKPSDVLEVVAVLEMSRPVCAPASELLTSERHHELWAPVSAAFATIGCSDWAHFATGQSSSDAE